MFEFLIARETNGEPEYHIVGLPGLLDEVQKALNDDGYCICVYEIYKRVFDWSLPRGQDLGREEPSVVKLVIEVELDDLDLLLDIGKELDVDVDSLDHIIRHAIRYRWCALVEEGEG